MKFLNITTEPSKTVKGVVVHLTVDEGPVYKLTKVSLSGSRARRPRISGRSPFKTDEVANFDEINESVDRMKKQLIHDGYIHAEAEIVRRLDDADKDGRAYW